VAQLAEQVGTGKLGWPPGASVTVLVLGSGTWSLLSSLTDIDRRIHLSIHSSSPGVSIRLTSTSYMCGSNGGSGGGLDGAGWSW